MKLDMNRDGIETLNNAPEKHSPDSKLGLRDTVSPAPAMMPRQHKPSWIVSVKDDYADDAIVW